MGVSSDQMVPWGYFVSPGKYPGGRFMSGNKLHILWVGRISRLKRVDTIIKALGCQRGDVEVTIVGDGPAKNEIMRLAVGYPVTFLPSQPIELIREIMRRHDVYVFPSNGMEGWGAVVNEALEEGMYVIGTRETGACATLLAEDALFSCGDWRRLGKLLIQCGDAKRQGVLKGQGIGLWTAESAAERLMGIA